MTPPVDASPATGCLSVVMACYNEAATILTVAKRVLESRLTGELIIVDDGSTDETLPRARALDDERVRVFAQPFNLGKGAALRRGFAEARMPFVIVQDADLEYDPHDYERLVGPLARGDADVVYGSRFSGGEEHRVLYFWHAVGNRLLTTLSNAATNLNLTDMETCYKAFRREVIQDIDLREDRFGFEAEITAKIARRGCRVFEVGVSYNGRTYPEGKKITWRDGVRAVYCIARYSAAPRRPAGGSAASAALSGREADVQLTDTLDDLDQAAPRYADWIVSLFEPHLGQDVLEIGAGHGTITERLARPGRRVTATDISERCVARLQARFADNPDVEVLADDVLQDPRGRSYDTVVLANVLEHVEDDLDLVRRIGRVLRPNGRLLIYVPAFPELYSRFDRLVGHVRRYRRATLATLMSRAELSVRDIRFVNLPGAAAWWLVSKKLGRIPTDPRLAGTYDRFLVPVTRRLEQRFAPPLGQSLLCVAERR